MLPQNNPDRHLFDHRLVANAGPSVSGTGGLRRTYVTCSSTGTGANVR